MAANSNTRATLLKRLCDGADPLAWDEFFERYWQLIYAWARRRGCSEHTAEEVVQDVMLAVFEKRDVYRYDPDRGRFRDWLGGVVRNQVALRRRQPSERVRGLGGDGQDGLGQVAAEQTLPEAAWEAAFEEAMLAALLDVIRREVNPRTYQAFELTALHELSGAEVARITGLTRNAVYLARRKVFRRLGQLGATYREEGQLDARIKQALQSRPSPAVERSLTDRIEQTMRQR